MKKIIILIMAITLLSAFAMLNVSAADVTVTGNSTLKAGDTLTLNIKFDETDLYGYSGRVEFDSTKLEYVSATGEVGTFTYAASSKQFSAFTLGQSIPGGMTMTFKVKATLTPGTSVSVKFCDLKRSVKVGDNAPTTKVAADVTYTKTIAAPPSSDATLSTLKITDANGGTEITLTPSFNKNVVSYTASVPFSVSKVNVSATTSDSKATATFTKSYTLKENSTTTITVNVKAENGTTKAYTVKVTRPKDPNYKPSTNADLASLTVTGHTFSPAFSKNTTAYTVTVPNGVSSVKVNAKAADAKASVKVSGGSNLVVGDNTVTITCTAESGAKKTYTIVVKREAAADIPVTTDAPITPSIDTTLVDESTGISCFIPAGKAPEGTAFAIQELTSGAEFDACASATDGVFKLYDPALMSDGAVIQPTGTVKITFPTLEGIDSESAHVYSIEDGVLTEIPFTSVDGHVVVETHQLGKIAVFASAASTPSEETGVADTSASTDTAPESQTTADTAVVTDAVGTDDTSSGISVSVFVVTAVAALLVGLAGGTVLGAALKSKKDKENG